MQSITEIYKKYPGRVRHLGLDVRVQANGKCFFPDEAILRDNLIVGMFITPNPDDDILSPVTNRPLVGEQTQNNSFLTLKCLNDSVTQNIPLSLFRVNDADREVFPLDMKKLTPSQSFAYISDETLVDVAQSFYFNFFYVIE